MTLQELENFVEVAKCGSIAQAAITLFSSPQAVSKSIKNLENDLGEQLFLRTFKGVSLTYFGEQFLYQVLPIANSVSSLTDFVSEHHANKSSKIRIILDSHSLYSYKMNRLSLQYQSEHPDVLLEINTSRVVDSEDLLSGKCDVLFSTNKPNMVNTQNCNVISLFRSNTVCIAHRDHILSNKQSVQWSDFSGVEFYLRTDNVSYAKAVLDKCVENGFYPSLGYRGDSIFDALYYVMDNRGAAFVPIFMAEFFQKLCDDVVILNCDVDFYTECVLVTNRNSKKRIVDDYVKYIVENIKKVDRAIL